jgi:glycosyl transferase family 25
MTACSRLRSLPIFVINLERDAERRRHMEAVLRGLGLEAEFVAAVDGRTLNDADRAAYDADRALRVYGVAMMDSELGCYLSHYRLYARMVREGLETALILEDDVEISQDLPAVLEDLLASPDRGWLVVRLESLRGHVREPRSTKFLGTRVAELPRGAGLYRLGTHVLGAGAYLIRRDGAERLLAYGKRIFMPIDHTMDRFWENGIVPYVVRPFPVRQRTDFESRIGTRGKDRHRGQPLRIQIQRRLQRISDGVRKRAFNLSRALTRSA